MKVVAELLKGINYLLRVVPNRHGDPYTVAVVADVSDDGTECELKGLDKPLLLSDARALQQWLKDYGIQTLTKERDGRVRKVHYRNRRRYGNQ